ncbi:MAG: hypothetical protein D6722_16990 [Bacteroidetes bacterium]|nr:MAG: hypothetical protein D6722_16990 [Bacteroidota bacterium]
MRQTPLIALLGLLLLGCGPDTTPPLPEQPNILLIFVDDMSWGSLPPYGKDYLDMPHLEKLAADGMLFTDAWVTPQCTPTRASLLTGQATARNRMWHVIGPYGHPYAKLSEPEYLEQLPRDTYTLGKALQDNGYTTGIFGKWHLSNDETGYYTYLLEPGREAYGWDYSNPQTDPTEYQNRPGKGVEMLTQEAMDFMSRAVAEGKPFFAYLSQHAMHSRVVTPDTLVEKYLRQGWPRQEIQVDRVHWGSNADYLGLLDYLDQSIGQLEAHLTELGITDNTVVIFLTDNGGEDEYFDNYPLRYGKGTPYEGGIRVPFIVKWPGQVPAGVQNTLPVQVADLYPTLVALAGGKMQQAHEVDGVDLSGVLTRGESLDRESLYGYMPLYDLLWGASPAAIIRQGDYKLIHYFGDWFDVEDSMAYHPEAKTELFNLKTDIGERHDLSEVEPERTAVMRQELLDWLVRMEVDLPTPNPRYNPDSVYVKRRGQQF